MKPPEKEIPRSRRPRTLPPPLVQAESLLPHSSDLDVEVPRFYGRAAHLAALSTQVRTLTQTKDKAVAAGRLARQLARRGIEIRDALALGEKSLTILSDPDLGLDVSLWWMNAGDSERGVALAESVIEELPETQRREALLSIARANIRLAKPEAAARALRRVIDLSPEDPTAYEILGTLGFWSDLPKDEMARSFLRGADLRIAKKDESNAFETRLRAFEVDPSCTEAATDLAEALRERGRAGAADEILREHLRSGSAAQRAAHHQRAFYNSLANSKYDACFESALEAELDIDLDVSRVYALVLDRAPLRQDFESFLWRLIVEDIWGQSNMLASWLLALCEVHRRPDADAQIAALSQVLVDRFQAEALPALDTSDNDQKARTLKIRLVTERDRTSNKELRFELTRRLCRQSLWDEALLVLAPLLESNEVSAAIAAFGAALGGRASNALLRVRAMVALAPLLPGPAGAVTYAVAAERLLNLGEVQEAHQAADAAVEAVPSNERALATQALVALRAPDAASASLLERSLSVLVARSDACLLLSESASQRGSTRLGLTWAARGLALRPGDPASARRFLEHACALLEPQKIAEAVLEVLEQPLPVHVLQAEVSNCLALLRGSDKALVQQVGYKILSTFSFAQGEPFSRLTEVAESVGATELLAALTESRLIGAASAARGGLYLELCRHRLDAGQVAPAARALRRAQLCGVEEQQLKELSAEFPETDEPDAQLALLEVRADCSSDITSEQRSERLFLAGCARWDMAQDPELAAQLWLRAADLDKERGLELFAHYLRQVAGSEAAALHLQEAARNTEEPLRSGRLLGFAAREMLRMGNKVEAFQIAAAALERAPALVELLSIAESSVETSTLADLARLYQLMADGALGKYGERAAHYRAARQLEKRGALEPALHHACLAFEAEPAEGVAYVLMARLADATLGHVHLLNSLQLVADRAKSPQESARWLSLAATLSDTESIGRKERLEILWRAAQLQPQRQTLDALFDGLAHCLADDPRSRDELWERFVKLARDMFAGASGAEGARRCLLLSVTALTHFEQPDFALEGVIAAINCDTTAGDFERLTPFVHQLAGMVGPATEVVEMVRATEDQKDAPLGKALGELVGKMAELLGERDVRIEFAVRSARDFPEDAELVDRARKLALGSGRPDLIAQVEDLLPPGERAQLVFDRLPLLSDQDALDALLEIDVGVLPNELKKGVLEHTARRQEAIGRLEDAAASYRALLAVDEQSHVALLGLERHAEAHGNHQDLLQILGRRIEASQDPGEVRRLTLRRAAVLETKLGRAPEARRLLQDFLGQGDDRAALRLLADSWERTGDHTEAAELWERVNSVALDSVEADDAAFRAADCFWRGGNPRRAKLVLERIKKPTLLHLELTLEVARSLGEKDQIYSAIIALCDVMVGDGVRQGKLLLEAAQLAVAQKRVNDARSCADRALLLLPNSSEVKLLVGRLRAQQGSLSTSLQAEEMRQLLLGTESLSSPPDREMATFLDAKSLILTGNTEGAQQLLELAIDEQGERPLLSALLSEILEDNERALRLVDIALGGECYGFYAEGELLLRAGALAQKLGDYERARKLISAVSHDDPLGAQAAQALETLSLEQARKECLDRDQDVATPNGSSDDQALSPPESRGAFAVPEDPPELSPASGGAESEPRSEGDQIALDAIRRAAREEHRRASRAASEHQELAGPTSRRSSRPVLRAVVAANMFPGQGQRSPDHLGDLSLDVGLNEEEGDHSEGEVTEGEEPGQAPGISAVTDEQLLAELEGGDVDAGLQLLDRLQADRSRSRDAVIVAQHLASLNASDAQLLGRLVTAAYRDGNEALAAAVRHVLGAYGVGEPVRAPTLNEVRDQNGAGLSLLRQAQGPANEALALVWEYAHGFFKRELSDYGISGLERIPFNSANLIGELCQGVSKVTGLMKIPVFRAGGTEEISIQVALLQPPAVLVSGVVEEVSSELMFHFGAMMAACTPEHALVFGADQRDVENVLSALALSFGSGRPDNRQRPPAEVTRVASYLWEAVPSRAQRRLSQLCGEPAELTFTALSGYSRLAVRRAGLLACGDLSTAIDDACGEYGLEPPRSLGDLAYVLRHCPAALDLFQLSLSSEYAQIRFQTVK